MAFGTRFRLKFKTVRRLRRDTSGATAVEFGLVATPFFALMFAIIEVALSFFTSQILETATADASRLVMTGQAQGASMDASAFKNEICSRLPSMFDCAAKVQVDVRTYANYAAANMNKPLVNGTVTWTPSYQPGVGGDLVIVRVTYEMPTYTNFYGASLANTNGGNLLLMATASFRNEPFSF